jgi:hypothetical protein
MAIGVLKPLVRALGIRDGTQATRTKDGENLDRVRLLLRAMHLLVLSEWSLRFL